MKIVIYIQIILKTCNTGRTTIISAVFKWIHFFSTCCGRICREVANVFCGLVPSLVMQMCTNMANNSENINLILTCSAKEQL